MATRTPDPTARTARSRVGRALNRLRRAVDDVRVRGHRRRAERALHEADHPEVTTLSYLTALALFVAPLVALVVFALFP